MWRKLSPQFFFAVFFPLLLIAGLFWLNEIRGYRGNILLIALPKNETAVGAAKNLSALASDPSFGLRVYSRVSDIQNPLLGQTLGKRRLIWNHIAHVHTLAGSDLITIELIGSTERETREVIEATSIELVHTASFYYNQKTDLDLRIVSPVEVFPSIENWSLFLVWSTATAFFFTILFFSVYALINRMFPQSSQMPQRAEYHISPETFRPKMPMYWSENQTDHEIPEKSVLSEFHGLEHHSSEETYVSPEEGRESSIVENNIVIPDIPSRENDFEEISATPLAGESGSTVPFRTENEVMEGTSLVEERSEEFPQEGEVPAFSPEDTFGEAYEPFSAAAPDNLPVVDDYPVTPLQSAQERLMRDDMAAQREFSAHRNESSSESPEPQTHEPTSEEYKRRLNELLSGRL